jgi:hypothetical protein
MAAALGWVAASQLDQFLLDVPLDLDLVWSRRLGLVVKGDQEAFRDKTLANTGDGSCSGTQSGDDFVIGTVLLCGSVR